MHILHIGLAHVDDAGDEYREADFPQHRQAYVLELGPALDGVQHLHGIFLIDNHVYMFSGSTEEMFRHL